MWLLAHFGARPAVLYHYDASRGRQTPLNVLSNRFAHARRKFVEAQKAMPKTSAPAHAPYLRTVGRGKASKAGADALVY